MKNYWLSLTILGTLLFSCGGAKKETTVIENDNPSTTEIPSYYYISSANNEQVANITLNGANVQLSLANEELFSEQKRADKRKYMNASNQMRYAIKLSEDGFKLRNSEEKLLWKVKFYDGKIKLANNEEMTNAFEVKQQETKLKIEQNGKELEVLRINPQSQSVRLRDTYLVRSFGNSTALGVLLLDAIPEKERFMLCAELLKHGK